MKNLREIEEPTFEFFNGEIEPVYYRNRLTIGDRSDIGLCTLWTKPEILNSQVGTNTYGIRGPLYSHRGVEYIIRNCLANPSIRTLVLAGSNANKSSDAVTKLYENGINSTGEIIGLVNSKGKPMVKLDPSLSVDIVNYFRGNVNLLNLVGERWESVAKVLNGIRSLQPHNKDRLYLPELIPTTSTLPSEKVGIRIERETIPDAWLEMQKYIRSFGDVKPSDKGVNLQELASLHILVSEPVEGIFERIPEWLPVGKEEIEAYLPMMLSSKPPQGENMAYTYGAAMKDYFGDGTLDQIDLIVQLIRDEWYTKRAYLTTWHLPENIVDQESSAPCLTDAAFLVQEDELVMVVHFRSHDMRRAWLENAYGVRFLQASMVDRLKDLGIGLGKLEIISNSAHLWQDVIRDADELIEEQYPRMALRWNPDPRGSFLISVEKGRIHLIHVDEGGNPTGKVFEGTDDQKIYREAIDIERLVSDPSHGAYLGSQLFKARLALESGQEYEQEEA